jgi:predicted lipoprotein with Yx(FWY)xxD motif
MTAARSVLLALAVVCALGACNRGEPTDSTQPAADATPPAAQVPPAGERATSPSGAATDATGMPPAANLPEPVTPNGADLGVAESAQHGRYLVDATGRALYLLEQDSNGTSTCHDACATQWPPLLAQQGTPRTLDPSLDDGAVGVIQRKDGTQQVSFNGHPLYHYARDTAAGQINGAGRKDQFGEWYLLGPEGNPLQGH